MRNKNNTYTVPEMCQNCTLYNGKGRRCPIQKEPGWLYKKYGTCWSKRTDPIIDKKIKRSMYDYSIEKWGYAKFRITEKSTSRSEAVSY
jgi:hypothetical protein